MSSKQGDNEYRIPKDGPWANAWKITAALGGLGALGCAFGWSSDPERFAFSWLFAFMAFLTIALGAMFFTIIGYLTNAGWSVSVRRTAEFFAAGIPIFALLFVPVLVGAPHLYEWYGHSAHGDDAAEETGDEEHSESLIGASTAQAQDAEPEAGEGEHAEEHGAHHTPMHAQHEALMKHKAKWLGSPYWQIRALVYFLIWILLALFFVRSSILQDESKDIQLTVRMQKFAAPSLILFALTLTFAGFDWMMALEPTWYSTIYGVVIFAGAAVSIYALVIVVTLGLRGSGLLGNAVTAEHYHDLGKMAFGFVVFHAYVSFSQMMLIWYANIPEETIYYWYRWHAEGWRGVSILLALGHFVLPFLFLMSRNVKRRLPMLAFGCSWLLVMHIIDIYWFVMPNVDRGHLSLHWMDLASVFAVGGIYVTVVLLIMKRFRLIPVGDPRLSRALKHVVHNA